MKKLTIHFDQWIYFWWCLWISPIAGMTPVQNTPLTKSVLYQNTSKGYYPPYLYSKHLDRVSSPKQYSILLNTPVGYVPWSVQYCIKHCYWIMSPYQHTIVQFYFLIPIQQNLPGWISAIFIYNFQNLHYLL